MMVKSQGEVDPGDVGEGWKSVERKELIYSIAIANGNAPG
jgi:hypothetical protein